MLKNYWKIAWRIVWKNKVFSSVNIIGLALSMACCLAISMYVWNETHFDTFHKDNVNIYRITNKQNQAGKLYLAAVTPGPLAPALQRDFPEIRNTVRFGNWSGLVKYGNKVYEERNVQITENSIFSIFSFPVLKGNPKTALLSSDEMVITETTAIKYFGNAWRNNSSLLGEVFSVNGSDFKLAAVVADLPANSSIQFDMLLPLSYLFKTDEWSNKWGSNNFHTYVQLKPETNMAVFEKKMAKQLKVYKPETDDQLQLQPLSKQYLYSKFDFFTDWGKRSDIKYVQIFTGVGILLLLIACVNFINLSTARSLKRSMEVGIRKVNGASRKQLVFQFLCESVLLAGISGIIAVGILSISQPTMSQLTGSVLQFNFTGGLFLSFLIIFIIVIGLFAGIYPAFILSAFKPISTLKGKTGMVTGTGFRKALVVVQFVICATMMMCILVMYQQLQFVQNKNLGFNSEQVVSVNLGGALRGKMPLFKEALNKESVIAATAPATMSLANVDNASNFEWTGMKPGEEFLITQANVDPDFIATMGMQLLTGENFKWQSEEDTINNFIVNETAVKMMGFTKEGVIGKQIKFWGANGKVIGVVKDFHFKPLSAGIEPFIFRYQPFAPYFNLFVKIVPGKTAEAINQIEKCYKQFESEVPLNFTFLNDSINQLYKEDRRTASVIFLFACLTIFIGCLGLFGLTVYAAEQRVKEMGIRKVLGASVLSITRLLSGDFLKLVLVAVIMAVPFAWYTSNQWLQNYAYRIELSWKAFAMVGLVVLAIALLTISLQAIKAAMANPVKSLRTE